MLMVRCLCFACLVVLAEASGRLVRRDSARIARRDGSASVITDGGIVRDGGGADDGPAAMHVFNTAVQKTVVVYLTHMAGDHQRNQISKLATEFGANLAVVSPSRMGNQSYYKSLEDLPTSQVIAEEHWGSLDPIAPRQAAVLLGHALLSALEPEIDYVWIMENDVFFKQASDVRDLVDEYARDDADYIPVNFFHDSARTFHITEYNALVTNPFDNLYGSFAPLMRVSKRFVNELVRFDKFHGRMLFFEPLFPTLAMHEGLKVTRLAEKFGGHIRFRPLWTEQEMNNASSSGIFFHPFKKA